VRPLSGRLFIVRARHEGGGRRRWQEGSSVSARPDAATVKCGGCATEPRRRLRLIWDPFHPHRRGTPASARPASSSYKRARAAPEPSRGRRGEASVRVVRAERAELAAAGRAAAQAITLDASSAGWLARAGSPDAGIKPLDTAAAQSHGRRAWARARGSPAAVRASSPGLSHLPQREAPSRARTDGPRPSEVRTNERCALSRRRSRAKEPVRSQQTGGPARAAAQRTENERNLCAICCLPAFPQDAAAP
jgi:hypothetical protein